MIAAVFPGQGSQAVGMGKELFEKYAAARETFDEVASATGIDVARLCFETPIEELTQTQNAQIALFACDVAAWRALHSETGAHARAMAGHSVGEYAALAAAGIVSVADGARLVRRRGELMAGAGKERSGTMSAIVGLDREKLEEICRSISHPQASSSQTNYSEGSDNNGPVVVIANDNCPGQLVISGDVAAVESAETRAKEAGARLVKRLQVSGAFHSPLMEESAKAMREELDPHLFHSAAGVRVYSNVTAERVDGATAWPDLLEAQLRSPVRWTESINNMIADGITTFVECGSGSVLSGLIRRVSKDVKTMSVDSAASLDEAKSALAGVPA